jgi:hypothetical protein
MIMAEWLAQVVKIECELWAAKFGANGRQSKLFDGWQVRTLGVTRTSYARSEFLPVLTLKPKLDVSPRSGDWHQQQLASNSIV